MLNKAADTIFDERPLTNDGQEYYERGTDGSVYDINRDRGNGDPFGMLSPNRGTTPQTEFSVERNENLMDERDILSYGDPVQMTEEAVSGKGNNGTGQILEFLGSNKILVYFPKSSVKLQILNKDEVRKIENFGQDKDVINEPMDSMSTAPDDYENLEQLRDIRKVDDISEDKNPEPNSATDW